MRRMARAAGRIMAVLLVNLVRVAPAGSRPMIRAAWCEVRLRGAGFGVVAGGCVRVAGHLGSPSPGQHWTPGAGARERPGCPRALVRIGRGG